MNEPPSHGAAPEAATLRLELGPRSYDIDVGQGLLPDIGKRIQPLLKSGRAIVVSDDTVAPLYLNKVMASLDSAAVPAASTVLPSGEKIKDFKHLEILSERIFEAGIDRGSLLVALGGGVIGDLTGFAAAITMRGIDFVQIPTTLLAQVDSSVGGKTGINSSFGKNLIGAFHQPRLVVADLDTLDTLSRRQLLAGYAEVVKYGLIDDASFFAWLQDNAAAMLDGDRDRQRHAVLTSCRAKAAIVAEDEHEHGRRALLNLGHTFGHALEAETGFGDVLLHGEAVAIGMVLAFRLSARLGLCSFEDAETVRAHVAGVGLPSAIAEVAAPGWTADRLIAHMGLDKKTEGGAIVFILARAIGQSFISRDVPPETLRSFLAEELAH